jgi:hypothetical protein
VLTEPASNMPAKNLGLRLMYSKMKEKTTTGYNTHLMPEIMYGISKNVMMHYAGFLSNRNYSMVPEGGSIYAKYKFLNKDDVKRHFRMAVFGRYSWNNADVHQEEINFIGHNTGAEIGMVATQLLHKVALSGSITYLKAGNNRKGNNFPSAQAKEGANLTLSFGKLMLPTEYKAYKQTNLNLMVEFLGQILPLSNKHYIDVAPSAQLIVNSRMRFDVAYRAQLKSNMYRTAPNGFLIRIEYNFFNIIK